MHVYNYKNPLVGKTVKRVTQDDGSITFHLNDGHCVVANVEGDCCSHTWIESLDQPEHLIGTVQSVEDIEMPDEDYDEKEHECLQFYGCKITTERGACVIDYRNSSNGYYGGSLSWSSHDD